MRKTVQNKECEKLIDMMEEVFSKDEVIIIGDNQINEKVHKLIEQCRLGGWYRDIKITCYNLINMNIDEVLYELINQDNKGKTLIICNEFTRLNRQWLKLVQSGFEKIINGIHLLNGGYCELEFIISDTESGVISYSNADKINKDVRHQFVGNDPYEDFILAAEEHKKQGEYLLAYDYYYMAYRMRKKKSDFEELIDLKSKIDFNNLTDHQIVTCLQKIISLNFYGRSGSMYCGCLFEGHSQIITLPPRLVYSPYEDFISLFYINKGIVSIDMIISLLCSCSDIREQYQECITMKVESRDNLYPKRYEEKFKKIMYELIREEITVKNGILKESFLYKSLVYAHTRALGRKVDCKNGLPYILDQQHSNNGEVMKKFLGFFEYNRVFFTIRNITQNFGSMLALMERQQMYLPQRVMNLFKYFAFNSILCKLVEDYHIFFLKIEQINLYPNEMMKKICEILLIEYEKSLENPTINGLKMLDSYGDNNYLYGCRKNGIIKEYTKYFTQNDRLRLEMLFEPLLGAMKYPISKADFYKINWDDDYLFMKYLQFDNEEEKKKYSGLIRRITDEILTRRNEIEKYMQNIEVV